MPIWVVYQYAPSTNIVKLLKDVWNYEFFGDLRTVDTHVKRLREKLNRVSEEAAKMIVTVWGVGYKFEVVNE